nr:PREDICTED: structure-specific endonuclease subunit SLX4 [Latimeria chalumnae]|eukprot:XP_014340852.1 PREDICTED: structure-specific endonuclease subunit SLX4 [Latimeria chalumnae]
MDESDDDFTELCTNLLKRVKKHGGEGEEKKAKGCQNEKKTSLVKAKSKEAKSTAKAKKKETKVVKLENPGCGNEKALLSHVTCVSKNADPKENNGADPCTNRVDQNVCRNIETVTERRSEEAAKSFGIPATGNSNVGFFLFVCFFSFSFFLNETVCLAGDGCTQNVWTGLEPVRSRVKDLVLERMQQFRRADSKRLTHRATEEPSKMIDEAKPHQCQENEDLREPLTGGDEALAWAVQQKLKQEVPREGVGNLDKAGFFFCQICQKDLSVMNATRRAQHINSTNSHPGGSKRKGSTKQKEPSKRQKTSRAGLMDEDMMVAMAMSRSLLEQEKQGQAETASAVTIKSENVFPIKYKPGTEKKRRKKKEEDAPPPLLLVQDAEATFRQIQNRMANLLLVQEVELPGTPQLLVSKLLEGGAVDQALYHPATERKHGGLWECSTLCNNNHYIPELYYTTELVPPIVPWKPQQNQEKKSILPSPRMSTFQISQRSAKSSNLPNSGSIESSVGVQRGETLGFHDDCCLENESVSRSQQDREALHDLMELAEEGLTLTQWNHGSGETSSHVMERTRRESTVDDIMPSGFVPLTKERGSRKRTRNLLLLHKLATDLRGMVNNPHLSDVQLQMDCGEVMYAHMFVLYARCPQLVQEVHSEGFLVEEDGNLRTRRLLLSEVTTEAVCVFLQYLYTASIEVPPRLLPEVQALAVRFNMNELVDLCEDRSGKEAENSPVIDSEDELSLEEEELEHCENRKENFQELLRSMWFDEEEEFDHLELKSEAQEDDEVQEDDKVAEEELDEIYEFAATQRKMVKVHDDTDIKNTEAVSNTETEDEPKDDKQKGKVYEDIGYQETKKVCRASHLEKNVGDTSKSLCQENKMDLSVNIESKYIQEESVSVNSQRGSDKCVGELYLSSSSTKETTTLEGLKIVETTKVLDVSRKDDKELHFKGDAALRPNPDHNISLDNSFNRVFSETWSEFSKLSQQNAQASVPSIQESNAAYSSLSFCQGFLSQKCVSPVIDLCESPPLNQYEPSLPSVELSEVLHRPNDKPSTSPESQPSVEEDVKKMSPIPFLDKNIHYLEDNRASYRACIKNEDDKSSGSFESSQLKTRSSEKLLSVNLDGVNGCPLKEQVCHMPSLFSREPQCSSPSSKEDDIILLLDSDEELEVKPIKSESESSFLDNECFIAKRTIDIQTIKHDNLLSISVNVEETKPPDNHLTESDKVSSSNKEKKSLKVCHASCMNVKDDLARESKPSLSTEHDLSFEESNVETSWLVPATPLSTQYRHDSTQSLSSCFSQYQKIKKTRLFEKTAGNEVSVINSSNGKPERVSTSKASPDTDLFAANSNSKTCFKGSIPGKQPDSSTQTSMDSLDLKNKGPSFTNLTSQKAEITSLPSVEKESLDSFKFEVEDSEEEAPEAVSLLSNESFQLENDPPIPFDEDFCSAPEYPQEQEDKGMESDTVGLKNKKSLSPISKVGRTEDEGLRTSVRTLEIRGSTPILGKAKHSTMFIPSPNHRPFGIIPPEEKHLSFFDSMVLDDWDGEDEVPGILPLSQRISAVPPTQRAKELKTPVAIDHKKNKGPVVPITPMPTYSDMDTPNLKQELSRFGVRPLPKRQMILKLKEIHQYTHQVMSSDSEEEIPSSQPCCHHSSVASQPTKPAPAIHIAKKPKGSTQPTSTGSKRLKLPSKGTAETSKQSSQLFKKPVEKKKSGQERKEETQTVLSPSKSPLKNRTGDSEDAEQLSASQGSTTSSTAGSEDSFASQSSSTNEFENAFVSGDEDEDDGITPSQAARCEADKLEAARQYLLSNPRLYSKILLYQPFELAQLQAELKENGIRIAMGKLLDFLDTHCITFTTAAARKEKQERKRQRGIKKRGRK